MADIDYLNYEKNIELLKSLVKEHEKLTNENIEKIPIELFVEKKSENIENRNKIIDNIKKIILSLPSKIEAYKKTNDNSNGLVKINARGTIIMVPRESIKRSKKIWKWFDKTDKEYYTSRNATDINSLLDYLEGKGYNDPNLIDEMIEEYEVELDDSKKNEYEEFDKECKDIMASGIRRDNKIICVSRKHKVNQKGIKTLAKKLLKYNDSICDNYCYINGNTIYLLINQEKEKKYIEQQEKIKLEKKILEEKIKEEEDNKIINFEYKKIIEDIRNIFKVATENTRLDISFEIKNDALYAKNMQYVQTEQGDSFFGGNFSGKHVLVWNIKFAKYWKLHIFLCNIKYQPYITYLKNVAGYIYTCPYHNCMECKKCSLEKFRNEMCTCCRKTLHFYKEGVAEIIGSFLGSPCFLMLTYKDIISNDRKPYRFIGIYLTYQSIMNNMEMVRYSLEPKNLAKINFKKSDKKYKYYWNEKGFFEKEEFVDETIFTK
jgi:hypothetical protein